MESNSKDIQSKSTADGIMLVLRIFWVIATILFTILMIVNFILCAWFGSVGQTLLVALGVLACFYFLYMLEGLQVAVLQIQSLDRDAVERVLQHHPFGSRKEIMPLYEVWNRNLDGFVVGRQISVIMTMVIIAFLLKSMQIPVETLNVESASLKYVIGFLNSTLFAYIGSTLIPFWYCQLVPQFLADGRAISFLTLPGARLVNGVAMGFDKIQYGYPAWAILNLILRSLKWGPRKYLTVGKRTYHETSLSFYGRAKKRHEISFVLGKPTTVKEMIAYMFQSGKNQHLDHKIQLSAPIVGDIDVKIELPDGVFGEVEVRDAFEAELYTYWIMITLNRPLPRERAETDEVLLEIEYQTNAYTDNVGIPYTTCFSSPLPTKEAKVSIQSGNHLLRMPSVRIVEEVDGRLTTALDNSKEGAGRYRTIIIKRKFCLIIRRWLPFIRSNSRPWT
jgi:hypothetical protein